MPKIIEAHAFDGANERLDRLGLRPVLDEIRACIEGFQLLVREAKDANGGAAVRKLIDAQFEANCGWTNTVSGDVDWVKCHSINGTRVCVGVEVQVSARSDLLIIDVIHLRNAIVKGIIDVGVIIVPSDELSYFLTDRGPCFSDAKRHVREARAEDLPLILWALQHDGAGPPLAKQKKRRQKLERPKRLPPHGSQADSSPQAHE